MKLNKYIITLSVALCTMLSGCTDWLDTQPNDKQSEEQQFSTLLNSTELNEYPPMR